MTTIAFVVGFLGLTSSLCTILGVSIQDIPLIGRFLVAVRIPYLVWNTLIFWRPSVSLLMSRTENTEKDKSVDYFLYLLQHLYRRLGVASPRMDMLGYSRQFSHRLTTREVEYEGLLRHLCDRHLDQTYAEDIDKIIQLWSPYLKDGFDSRLAEVIQTSILTCLGYRTNAKSRLDLAFFVRDFFVLRCIHDKDRGPKYLSDFEEALEWLVPEEKLDKYDLGYEKILEDFDRQQVIHNFVIFCTYLDRLITNTQSNL